MLNNHLKLMEVIMIAFMEANLFEIKDKLIKDH